MKQLHLAFGLPFEDLYSQEGLQRIDRYFIEHLLESSVELHNRLLQGRADPKQLTAKETSQLLLDIAPVLEDFIAHLFGIEAEVRTLAAEHQALAVVYQCKRLFVQRRAAKAYKPEEAARFDGTYLRHALETFFLAPLNERIFAEHVMQWLQEEEQHHTPLDLATRYAAWSLLTEEGQHQHKEGVLFKSPKKLDIEHLVPVETVEKDGVLMAQLPAKELRRREGFALTDAGATLEQALDHAHYCIFCHNQGKDSCSKGMREKDGGFKKSPLSVTLAGCPLEEKISEMHTLKAAGQSIAALAMVTIDNPMVAATGHRICNDCMKACIYQKQEPVNIPQAETRTLRDVLSLPWGFEIYSLLTRWNPLHLERPLPKPGTGYKVLIAGLGPAGFTLAHHLLNDGHGVVAIDGLKIEPLPPALSGITPYGERVPFAPIHRCEDIFESLDDRVLAGFGGVAEYGITVRWNKNYLKLIRLLLERRSHFALYGGVRYGGTITQETAFALGFDHVALAMGAGKPTIISVPGALARGVRTASDFLMALQLTGAAKKDSIANLQVRLPVLVIGGGLTAIDAATESLAYYPVQVEKFLQRYEALKAIRSEAEIRQDWTAEETDIAEEFISHATLLRAEREAAHKEGREPDLLRLLQSWGGATVVYRRGLTEAPSYRLNHEEVELAMQEGIRFADHLVPLKIESDTYGHALALHASHHDQVITLPARTIFMAAGTSPNTVLAREDPQHIVCEGNSFRAINEEGETVIPERVSKPQKPYVLMSITDEGRAVSFFGDLHPSFAGNVVKAMGSAKQGYPVISRVLHKRAPGNESMEAFVGRMNTLLRARIETVKRLTPTIVEVIVRAPLAAERFQPGQFYRLQNYEYFARTHQHASALRTTLAMEGLALTGAWVDKAHGLLSMIVLEMGGSSDICATLPPGEPVVVMGPTGTPTHIPAGETVLLAGGGLGNAVLFSIGKALREAGSHVLYFAGYKKSIDRYKIKEIEEAADCIVWCCDEERLSPDRPQDFSVHGTIVQAMQAYACGDLGKVPIPMSSIDRLLAIGSDRMMAAIAEARHTVLAPYLNPAHEALGSINSPMQCMMKEICAQCLQRHVDPVLGKESYVYSCFNQDQCLDKVDFAFLHERLKQNTVQEKLTRRWVDYCLRSLHLR